MQSRWHGRPAPAGPFTAAGMLLFAPRSSNPALNPRYFVGFYNFFDLISNKKGGDD
jgi:hypothetical protein